MSDQATLTEKTGVVVFARIVTTVIDLAMVVAVIHILNKTEFAIIGYLLMIHEVARNLATIGFPESIFYYFERVTKTARKAFVIQTSAILAVLSVIAGLLILAISYLVPQWLTNWPAASIDTLQNLLPLMALVTILEVPTWPVTNILLASERQKEASWYEMITSTLSVVCVVIPLLAGYSLEAAIYGLVGYAIVRFIGSIIWMMLILPERTKKSSKIGLKEQFQFSIPLGFSSLANKLNRYADKFIVSILLSAAAFAEYTIAAQEVPIIRVIPFAVGSVLISRYVNLQMESKKEELLALWHKGIEKVSLMVIPLTILCIISASDLIALIAGSEDTSYQNAVIPFQIYNLIVLIRVTHYGSILQAFGDTKGVMYLSINLIIANILLTVPLTILWGINGAALGTLLANLYNWYIMLRRIGGHMEVPAKRVLPFGFYLRVLGTAVLVGVPVWASRFYLFADEEVLLGLAWSIPVYLILFGVVGTGFKIITSKEWKQLKYWLALKFLRDG